MEKNEKNKGVTLIALVITIIVLLILAGVSISTLTGQNGILKRAIEAKNTTEVASEKEGIQMAVTTSQMASANYTSIKKDGLQSELNSYFGKEKTTLEDNKDGSYTVTMNNSKRKYTIEDDGSIIEGVYDKWNGTDSKEPTEKTSNEIHIYTVAELKWIADKVNNDGNTFDGYTIYLENNLDFGARETSGTWENTENEALKWTAIGKQKDIPLKATFEGNNHIIKGVYINDETKFNGIFGNSSSILNLTVKNSYIKGGNASGTVVGAVRSGTIENCHNINSTVELYDESSGVGGVVGQVKGVIKNCTNIGGRVVGKKSANGGTQAGGVVGLLVTGGSQAINCYNAGDVTGEGNWVGGVVGGANTSSTIQDCYNMGNVTGKGNFVGGVVGYANPSSTIQECYNTGNVTGEGKNVGGVVGGANTSSTIQDCYNTGNVTGEGNLVGGVAGGANPSSTIQDCYNTGNVTGEGNFVGGVAGGADTSSTIQDCYNMGNVTGEGHNVGGVAGYANTSSTIQDCYNTGNVTGDETVGGVVGCAANIVTKCYNTGTIVSKGISGTGGIVGDCITKIPQDISLCFNAGTVQAPEGAGGISGYLGAKGYAAKETKCYNKGKVICTQSNTCRGEIIGEIASDATVTNSYYFTNETSRYGVGAITAGGDLEAKRNGTQKTTTNLNSYEEFLTWIEQQ